MVLFKLRSALGLFLLAPLLAHADVFVYDFSSFNGFTYISPTLITTPTTFVPFSCSNPAVCATATIDPVAGLISIHDTGGEEVAMLGPDHANFFVPGDHELLGGVFGIVDVTNPGDYIYAYNLGPFGFIYESPDLITAPRTFAPSICSRSNVCTTATIDPVGGSISLIGTGGEAVTTSISIDGFFLPGDHSLGDQSNFAIIPTAVNPQQAPEPSLEALFAAGAIVLLAMQHRRGRRANFRAAPDC